MTLHTPQVRLLTPHRRLCTKVLLAQKVGVLHKKSVMRVLQQPEVIISGIESLRTVDDGQLEKKMGHAERELRDVKGEEERLLRFLVMGKISEAQFDHQQTFITERDKNLRASLDEYRNQMAMATEAWNTRAGASQWAEVVREGLEALSPEECREVLLLVLDGATIDGDDKVCITFSIPIQELAVTEETLKLVPPFVIPMGSRETLGEAP